VEYWHIGDAAGPAPGVRQSITPTLQYSNTLLLTVLAAALLSGTGVLAQSFRYGGTQLNAKRPIDVLAGKSYSIVVTEFFHHGEINDKGTNVLVAARNRKICPMKVLQLGPGDFCRLAFEPAIGQTGYDVFYGGEPLEEPPPPLTSRDGLLLETRHYKHCNLNRLDAVRKAFESAKPFGADYVDNVHHSANPFSPNLEPFLSHYSGHLHVTTPGKYGFMTSSQDASFLLVDDKLVVAAPGRHGPRRRALRGSRKDVQLSAGDHKFDYYHAATGSSAVMAIAWEFRPRSDKPIPKKVPDEIFGSHRVAHLPAGRVTTRTTTNVPDFDVKIAGEVPLPDNPVPLIGVLFRDMSPKALTLQGKIRWDFGDGQTSNMPNPDHVYLRPGIYAVKLSIKRSSRVSEITQRIEIGRPFLTYKDKMHTLDEYLPIVETYNPQTLDAASLRQLVLTYEAKSLQLETRADELQEKLAEAIRERQEDPDWVATDEEKEKAAAITGQIEELRKESRTHLSKAATTGMTAFTKESTARGDDELLKLARLIAPMARERFGDSSIAAKIWYGAAQKVTNPALRGQCEAESADIAINDLLNKSAAKTLLDSATKHLGGTKTGEAASHLQRVWGDYYAWTGDGEAARKAYREAEKALGSKRRYIESAAWLGAHSRSTEEFVQQKQFDRAAEQIRQWLADFPAARLEGYLTLLYVRYWAARGQHAQAVAQAGQLQEVNPESPYVDQILMLAADCEMRRGRKDAALAILHSILQDYPGSPLVPAAKKNIQVLEGGKKE